MDRKRILSLLDRVNQYSGELKSALPPTEKEYLQNLHIRRACERTLQLVIETCIDTCHLLLKELKLGLPEEEETAFDKLCDEEVLSEEMTALLKQMKKFRNVLIHLYEKIDDHLVYRNAARGLKDFTLFEKEVRAFLRK